ncbi:hypothetical protein HPB50_021718 [Hyalomma asiaticum]|uniref:Uncharacterized protein n=1 Tax=Hyalomma asiaticum TaxID=266040 RepID=A0ACB7TF55_HYAAI|nr:hypothetical protein HPB50_021718 [Hyalomma asiaticum]
MASEFALCVSVFSFLSLASKQRQRWRGGLTWSEELLHHESPAPSWTDEMGLQQLSPSTGCRVHTSPNVDPDRETRRKRLPQNVVIALATTPDDLPFDKLAELADRVVDYSGRGTLAQTSTVPLSQLENRHSHLEQLIDDLAETLPTLPPSSTRPRLPFQVVPSV